MKIVIIEDEHLTAEDLSDAILRIEPSYQVIAILSSVKEAIDFFDQKPEADLIFSDIQLGDGLSFEIFKNRQIQIPVIFCTAYDEYALNAFQANSIDYILKPFSTATIKASLDKYKSLKEAMAPQGNISQTGIEQLLVNMDSRPKSSSILIHYKDQIIPIPEKDIALISIKNESTSIKTFENKVYFVNKTLDELENKLGSIFFRANRQNLVNRSAVKSVEQYGARKLALILSVPHSETVSVSKEKHTPLMNWLESH